MSKEQLDYLSYLLRLWRENGGGRTTWRASLESSLTGKRHVFPNLDELCAFLRRQMDVRPEPGQDEDATSQGEQLNPE